MDRIIVPRPSKAETMELPDEIKGAARADRVLREQDLNRKERADAEEGWQTLAMPKPKEKDIEIEVQINRILVKYAGNVVGVIRWLSQNSSFHIKRRVQTMTGTRSEEYLAPFATAWEVAAAYGVTAMEFSKAFVEMPVPGEWRFDLCPEKRTDCQLRLTEGALGGIPRLTCKVCNASFNMDKEGQLKLESAREFVGKPILNERAKKEEEKEAQDNFDQEFVKMKGMGSAKLRVLKEAKMASWKALADSSPEEIACLSSFSPRTATFIHKAARMAVGLD